MIVQAVSVHLPQLEKPLTPFTCIYLKILTTTPLSCRVLGPCLGGAVASWSVSLTHCVVFLGKTLDSHSASLHPGV